MSGETITACLPRHAGATPERAAIVCDGDTITWDALNATVERLAAHLARRVPPGCGVALHLGNGPALALLFLAAARAGREAQILDAAWPLATTRATIAALAPGLVVSTDAALTGEAATVVIDAQLPFAQLADALGASIDSAPPPPDPLAPFYVGFTSGSTGLPKGFRRHHRSWVDSFRAGDREFDIGASDVVLAPGSLTHSLFLYALAHGLDVGATVVLCRAFRPSHVVRLMRQYDASVLYGVPTQLEMIVEAAARQRAPFPVLRWVLSSGAKWQGRASADLRRLFPAARFAEFYGASELSFTTVARDDEEVPAGSVGRAFAGVELTIRDHRGRVLPPGEAGEVFVKSPFLFMGYACGEAAPLRQADGAVSVGDVGVLDARGFLRLVGRASRMIITSGKNVHPEEIERVLETHPAVAQAMVLGSDDMRRGERLVALVRFRDGATTDAPALIAHARAALPLARVPRCYAVPPQWPSTSSGKSDFAALRR
ncbi:MAG: AMP-binding protein, partial [Xanthobacteraceae bacterium]